jgi:hypothetical protein
MESIMSAQRLRATSASTGGDNQVSVTVLAVVIVALLATAIILIAMNSSLYGDGSYYLLATIKSGRPFNVSGRELSNAVRETPLLIGTSIGVDNTRFLTILQGIGFILFPALIWVLALLQSRISRLRFSLVAIACGISFGSMIFYSVSELTLALPLVVLISCLLAKETEYSILQSFFMVIAAAILVFSYEAIALCSVILAVHAVLRAKAGLTSMDTFVSWMVAVLSVATIGVSLWTLEFRPNGNSGNFLNSIEEFHPKSEVALIFAGVCIATWILVQALRPNLRWITVPVLGVIAFSTLVGVVLAIQAGPLTSILSRGYCVFLIAALEVAFLIDWTRKRRRGAYCDFVKVSTVNVTVAVMFLLCLLAIPIIFAIPWSGFLGEFRSTINSNTGVLPSADLHSSNAGKYLLGWPDPSMSVILRASANSAVVASPDPAFAPFNPIDASRQIPPRYSWR